MTRRFWTWLLATLALSASALADLPNSGVPVTMVESGDGVVLIHLGKNLASKPDCAQYQTIVACSLGKPYCAQVFSLALAAKLANKTIEFQVANTCINFGGNAAEILRLRIQ